MTEQHFDIEVTFKTAMPLSQECGLDMWALGNYFTSVKNSGGRTYKLKAMSSAIDMIDALVAVTETIQYNVNKHDKSDWSKVVFTQMKGKIA